MFKEIFEIVKIFLWNTSFPNFSISLYCRAWICKTILIMHVKRLQRTSKQRTRFDTWSLVPHGERVCVSYRHTEKVESRTRKLVIKLARKNLLFRSGSILSSFRCGACWKILTTPFNFVRRHCFEEGSVQIGAQFDTHSHQTCNSYAVQRKAVPNCTGKGAICHPRKCNN